MRIAKTTFEKYARPRHLHLFGADAGIRRRLTDFFGCRHKDMSRPFSCQGETYRTCLTCGARRQFDPENWETRGNYYRMEIVDSRVTQVLYESPQMENGKWKMANEK
jgi:hypothetical protein